jgi:cyanate permease
VGLIAAYAFIVGPINRSSSDSRRLAAPLVRLALSKLAHEVVHLLAPADGTLMIEEGIAIAR